MSMIPLKVSIAKTMNKELNILVLGETGVGKSTWINSLLNYISFLTLDEAMKEDQLQWLISSSFVITTTMGKKLIQQEIKVGDSANEDTTIGNSATQTATPYVIKAENFTFRLIDTPGIGDTRGTEQDQKNMEGILNTINCYEELHGIVILLKPNDSRIGVMFRFVVQELLTHLHRNAAQNIVFGFTNTRQTHFQPGNTLPSLTKLLSNMASDLIELTTDTVYNFDSESFRFLAAHKQGVDLGYKADYQKSWERSVEESIRMLSYIASLPPHPITNTVTLNASRKLIADLTKPMAEISRLITLNIKMNEEESILLQVSFSVQGLIVSSLTIAVYLTGNECIRSGTAKKAQGQEDRFESSFPISAGYSMYKFKLYSSPLLWWPSSDELYHPLSQSMLSDRCSNGYG